MPVPVAQGATSNVGGSVTSLALSTPKRNDGTALVAGDTLFASIAATATITPPAGWTLVENATNNTLNHSVYRRTVASSEPTSHTFTFGTSTLVVGIIAAVSGAAEVPDASSKLFTDSAGANSTSLSVTTAGPDRLLLDFHHWSGGNLVDSSTATPPTGMSEKIERNTGAAASVNRLMEVNHVAQAAAGASGDKTAASSHSAGRNTGILIALKESGVSVALAGDSSTTSSATGALSSRDALQGSSASQSSASGTLRSEKSLAGSSATGSSSSGTLRSTKSLAGFSETVSGASGSVFLAVFLVSISETISSAQGALSATKSLAGRSASASSATGTLYLKAQPSAAAAIAARRQRRVARTLAGYFGPVDLQYRLYRSDKHARELQEITDWEAGDISLGNDREAGWALSVDMRRTDQIDPWRDYVLAMAELAVGGDPEDLERFPLGLYRTARDEMLPAITYLEELELWSLQMESQEAELAEWPPEAVYSVAAGTGVLAAVRRILNMLGWPDTLITFPPPSEDSPLASTMVLDPFEDSGESNWLSFCNALLGSRSFYALKTDRWGKWFTEKIRDAADFPPDVHYGPDPLEPLIVGDIQEGRDTTRFANVVIAASQDTSQVPRVSATVINDDPDSPASVRNYRRRVYKRVERQSIGSAADARTIARAELARSASFHRSPRIATLADPRRFQIRQTYRITDYSGEREILTEVPRWDVTSVSLPINHSGEQETMTHELGAVYPMETRIV